MKKSTENKSSAIFANGIHPRPILLQENFVNHSLICCLMSEAVGLKHFFIEMAGPSSLYHVKTIQKLWLNAKGPAM